MQEALVCKADTRPELWLPPESARRWNSKRDDKIDTPLDERGFADLDKLVKIGKGTVVNGYDWTSSFNDVHHLQWPAADYSKQSGSSAHAFRELVQRKTFIPRRFHNWLHRITLPPPLPSEEAMRYSIQAERSVRAMAATARLAVRLTRHEGISDAKLLRRLEQEFDNYTLYIENAREVPVEFQLLELAKVEAKDVDEMLRANKQLGRLALQYIPRRLRAYS